MPQSLLYLALVTVTVMQNHSAESMQPVIHPDTLIKLGFFLQLTAGVL